MCFNIHLRTYRNKPIAKLLSTSSGVDCKFETMSSNIFLLVWKRFPSFHYKRKVKNLVRDFFFQFWEGS